MAHMLCEIRALSPQRCEWSYCFQHVSIPRLIPRLCCKLFQTQASVRHAAPVQTCGIASRQSGSDKPLTEACKLICYHWKGAALRNTEQTGEEDHPSGNTWVNTLYGPLIFLFDLGSPFPGSPPFSSESALARSSDAWMSLSVMESEAFYIRSVPGDGLHIFINPCELLPKTSNPLQACL